MTLVLNVLPYHLSNLSFVCFPLELYGFKKHWENTEETRWPSWIVSGSFHRSRCPVPQARRWAQGENSNSASLVRWYTYFSFKQVFGLEVKLCELLTLLVRQFWPQMLQWLRYSWQGRYSHTCSMCNPSGIYGCSLLCRCNCPAVSCVTYPPAPSRNGAIPRAKHHLWCWSAGHWALAVAGYLWDPVAASGQCFPNGECSLPRRVWSCPTFWARCLLLK